MDDKERRFSFFQHRACEYFPCHKGVKEEEFNCLFCYCPLYMLGEQCGGNFEILSDGTKSCMHCVMPHVRSNYDRVIGRFDEMTQAMHLTPQKKPTQK